MLRSISFVIEGRVSTQVRVAGNLDGTLSFEFTRLDLGSVGDLKAVFLDLNRPVDGAGFKVFGDSGFTEGAYARQSVDTLGRAAGITPAFVDDLGDFDLGIAFGGLDPDRGAARTTGFTLAHDTAPLTLDMMDLADFGLRYVWPGAGCVAEPGRENAGGPPMGVAGRDALEVIEIPHVRARSLADDSDGGVLAVIDFHGVREAVAGGVGAPELVYEEQGGAFGGDLVGGARRDRGTGAGAGGLGAEPRARPRPGRSWDGLRPLM